VSTAGMQEQETNLWHKREEGQFPGLECLFPALEDPRLL
jgi:hypothetical protein